jgi:hypothetical protein
MCLPLDLRDCRATGKRVVERAHVVTRHVHVPPGLRRTGNALMDAEVQAVLWLVEEEGIGHAFAEPDVEDFVPCVAWRRERDFVRPVPRHVVGSRRGDVVAVPRAARQGGIWRPGTPVNSSAINDECRVGIAQVRAQMPLKVRDKEFRRGHGRCRESHGQDTHEDCSDQRGVTGERTRTEEGWQRTTASPR